MNWIGDTQEGRQLSDLRFVQADEGLNRKVINATLNEPAHQPLSTIGGTQQEPILIPGFLFQDVAALDMPSVDSVFNLTERTSENRTAGFLVGRIGASQAQRGDKGGLAKFQAINSMKAAADWSP